MFKKNYIQIQIRCKSSNVAEMLLAALSEINYYAFEEENNLLNAYVNEEDFDEKKLKDILSEETNYSKKIIVDENWNEQWESQIKPVIVNNFAAIRPAFHPQIKNVEHELIITPKMSFGTGHHATTFLMIELMQKINFKNKTVVDFGTGTGVLSILAEKCGASKVVAIDYDEWSIENAKENIENNFCKKIVVKPQSDLSGIEQADIILANINLNVLKNQSVSLSSLLTSGSLLLISGFLYSDESEMKNIFEQKNLVKLQSKQNGDWLAMIFEKY